VELIWELMPDDIGVSVTYPLPGSPLYERLRGEIGEKANWTDSSDLAMVFGGRYGSDFYRTLHDVLHDDLDLRRRRGATRDAEARIPREAGGLAEMWAELERQATA